MRCESSHRIYAFENWNYLSSTVAPASASFSLKSFCICCWHSFFDCRRCAVNDFLSFLKTKTCCFTNSLDNSDFVCAYICKNNIKLCLFFCSCCARLPELLLLLLLQRLRRILLLLLIRALKALKNCKSFKLFNNFCYIL